MNDETHSGLEPKMHSGSGPETHSRVDAETYSVVELSVLIGRAVARVFPDEVWVKGEIRDLTRAASGHVYFTLVDAESGNAAAAVLPVTLFAADREAVNRVLVRTGTMRMSDGVAVRIRGSVGHYARRGTVQLRMTWIDPEYTMGKLAADRDRLLRTLRGRGLVDRNRSLPLPPVPLRIGLITSAGSAAHADFMDELAASGYRWQVVRFDARVQGADAVSDISRGIKLLDTRGLDAIAVVRGGGAQTDLAAFDAEEVALAIAGAATPVLTGIGHETDVTVAELVARGFKTPTACAAELVATVDHFVARIAAAAAATRRAVRARLDLAGGQLDHMISRMGRSSVATITRAGSEVTEAASRIERASRAMLAHRHAELVSIHRRVGRSASRTTVTADRALSVARANVAAVARRRLAGAARRLGDFEHRAGLLDPAAALRRGWSITRSQDGALVFSPEQVVQGEDLITTVAGGTIRSVVMAPDEVADD